MLLIHNSIGHEGVDRRMGLLHFDEVSLDQLLLGLEVELAEDQGEVLAEAPSSWALHVDG